MLHDLLSDDVSAIRTGDRRLDRRCQQVMAAFMAGPGRSIPETMVTDAATEGLYRALRNERVTAERLIGPHRSGTWQRALFAAARPSDGERPPASTKARDFNCRSDDIGRFIVALHDTTDLTYRGEKPRSGLPHDGEKSRLYMHASALVCEGEQGELLGIVHHDLYAVAEGCWIPLDSEACTWDKELIVGSERWQESVRTVASACPPGRPVVHVMDREADDYGLWNVVLEFGHDMVVRGCVSRRTKQPDGAAPRVTQLRDGLSQVVCREVYLSRRSGGRPPATRSTHPDRETRSAKLEIGVGSAVFVRPDGYPLGWRSEISLNILHVTEKEPPDGVEPVDWLLYTTLPVESAGDALRVVDLYRRRWLIEEFFKALKTGCAAEELQLESAQTLKKMLAILIPSAWRLMALRTLSRDERDLPASQVLDEVELAVLRTQPAGKSLPAAPTIKQVTLAIARLGGLLRQNGAPGWAVLHRGLQVLIGLSEGWRLAVQALGLDRSSTARPGGRPKL